jgi:hypothetical protein
MARCFLKRRKKRRTAWKADNVNQTTWIGKFMEWLQLIHILPPPLSARLLWRPSKEWKQRSREFAHNLS